jgi:hypothetical protein
MRLCVPRESGITVPSSAEKMLQNVPVLRLKGGNTTTGLHSSRLVTRPRELNITLKPQYYDNRTAKLMNYSKKTVKQKWKEQNIIKYVTWNVSGIAYKEEELDSVFNEKQIKIAAVTQSKKKLKCTIETNNYIVIYSGVNRSTERKRV